MLVCFDRRVDELLYGPQSTHGRFPRDIDKGFELGLAMG